MIELQNVVKEYREHQFKVVALNKVNVSIEKGDFMAIMGPSGSGKSTLMNMITGISTPTEGKILFKGQQLQSLSFDQSAEFRRKEIGIVYQEFHLIDSLNAAENIALPLILSGHNAKDVSKKVNEIAQYLGISKQLKQYPHTLSGGQKQRVCIARALVNSPEIILADEPTGNLDTKSSNNIIDLLSKINKEKCNTVIIITHNPIIASKCSKVIYLKDGQVVKQMENINSQKEFLDRIVEMEIKWGNTA